MAENRARKAGLAGEIDRKLESRYDEVEAGGTMNAVMIWLNAVIGSDHDKIPSSEHKALHTALRDGILLCKVMNKLLDHAGKGKCSFSKKCASPFVAMGNSDNFCTACVEYGLKKECVFQSTDLWEGRKGPFLNVINCVHSLGFAANEKGFPVTYQGKDTKFLDNE